MTPDRIIALLSPILDRVRTGDHWIVPKGGSPSHRTTPLTSGLLLNHVLHLHRVGLCPMARGSSVTRIALLDLDSHKGETRWPAMLAKAREVMDAGLVLHGLRFIPFRSSGGRGLHLFAIWPKDQPQDARSVRAALAEVLDACAMKNGTKGVAAGHIEIFPKQDSIPEDGFGNMFVLPMSGESVPLDPETLAELHLVDVQWPDSDPVPVVAPPAPIVRTGYSTPEFERVRSALFAVDPNELDYGGNAGSIGWLEILFAVHAATDGSADGLALMLEWSSQWNGFDEASVAETEKQWTFAKAKPGGIGPGTLFRRAVTAGWVDPARAPDATGFEVLVGADPMPPDPLAENPFVGDGPPPEGRGLKGSISEVTAALERAAPDRLAWDEFNAEIVLRVEGGWRAMTDEDITDARVALERRGGFASVAKETMRDALYRVAMGNQIDTGRDWLESLPAWDGVPRVATFLHRYLGAPDTRYTRAVSRYLLTALVGRVLKPGCQADMVPVLVGDQGVGKTQTIKALLPDRKFYAEIDLTKRDVDQARLLRGKIIGEIAELRGLATRDHESIKAWITREDEEWTPKYRESNIRYRRRCVFIGTTNQRQFLADETGNRRWLPVTVSRCLPGAVARDREQLLAEALSVYLVDGIDYSDAEKLAASEHEQYAVDDPWAEPVAEYLAEIGGRVFTQREIFSQVLRFETRYVDTRSGNRLGRVLHALGCTRHTGRDPHTRRNAKVWRAPASLTVAAEDLL